jgi:hypothetical protein
MKSPPVQYPDDIARRMTDDFIAPEGAEIRHILADDP